MPSLLIERHRFADEELRPDFVSRNICGEKFGTAYPKRFSLGQNCRDQYRTGMTVERHIIVIQHMGGRGINECHIFDVTLFA